MTDTKIDVHDGDAWTEDQVDDLRRSLAHGNSIEDAAAFLCRGGTVDDVARKAEELGLSYHHKQPSPPLPQHTVTAADAFDGGAGFWGIRFEYDDGLVEEVFFAGRKAAEFYARDRVGERRPIGVNPLLLPGSRSRV
jgi:hypothetical protein